MSAVGAYAPVSPKRLTIARKFTAARAVRIIKPRLWLSCAASSAALALNSRHELTAVRSLQSASGIPRRDRERACEIPRRHKQLGLRARRLRDSYRTRDTHERRSRQSPSEAHLDD